MTGPSTASTQTSTYAHGKAPVDFSHSFFNHSDVRLQWIHSCKIYILILNISNIFYLLTDTHYDYGRQDKITVRPDREQPATAPTITATTKRYNQQRARKISSGEENYPDG